MIKNSFIEKTKNNKRLKKISHSGLRILEILKELSKEPLDFDEMMKIIEEKPEISPVYARETLVKYLCTIKSIGYEIYKKHNKYILTNNIDPVNLNNENIRIFKFLKQYCEKTCMNETHPYLDNFFEIIEKKFDADTRKRYENVKRNISIGKFNIRIKPEIIKQFEYYCKAKSKLTVNYKENNTVSTYYVEPRSVIFNKDIPYLIAFDPKNRNFKKFKIGEIVESRTSPEQNSNDNTESRNITYQIKNRLAKSYVIKDNEKYLKFDRSGVVLVSNTNEDINDLIPRLLRYGEHCKLLYPVEIQKDVINYIDNILGLYDEQQN